MASPAGLLSFDWDTDISEADRDRITDGIVKNVDRWRMRLPAFLLFSGMAPFGNLAAHTLIFGSPFAAVVYPGGLTELQKLVRFIAEPRNLSKLADRLAEDKDGTR